MHRLSISARLALCVAGLTISVLLLAQTLGLLPDDRAATLRGRAQLCESLASHLSILARQGQTASLQTALQAVAKSNPDVKSLAVRQRNNGQILAEVGDHLRNWQPLAKGQSTATHFSIPILDHGSEWGQLEVRFASVGQFGGWSSRVGRFLILLGFVLVCCGVLYYLYLRNVMKHPNPQRVISGQVKMALDTMAEGLVILDGGGVIMLANSAFAETVESEPDHLLGRPLEELPWEQHQHENQILPLPWKPTLEEAKPALGGIVHLTMEQDQRLTFLVNVSPILDPAGQNRGALVSFDDITQLEKNKLELHEMLENLRKSSDEIRRQNRELEQLATRDPLTSCYNRRSFFERFHTLWKSATRHDHPLSCVMVDVDHFKSINDNHGHSVGDEVLQRVGQVLNQTAREADIVCRYGGEEFAILLPYTDMDDAAETAERFRRGLENAQFPNLSITASLGVSAMSLGALDPQELLDQADKCLYVAKRNGRNQVVRYDNIPPDLEVDESQIARTKPAENANQTAIPFQAVTALVSALAYRDVATAEHSRRVADLCVATGEGLMSLSSCYVLENAALLHDIGKIGVPDSILLKPGALTDEEWEVMRRQERIGVEIIRASFDSRELVAIVANHQAWYGGTPHASHLPTGDDIPLGARILNIVNAYDAMTSKQVYREARTPEQAFAELRRCAGKQFDPAIVERFIGVATVRQHFPTPNLSNISQETALQFGLQIESLMAALDNQDVSGLQVLADRLHEIAQKCQVSEIAEKASELAKSTQKKSDVTEVLNTANELIELCRSTQSCYIQISEDV